MRQIDEIIIHCSATPAQWMDGAGVEAKRDEIRRWHVQERGWSDIGYHAVIDRDGRIAAGRDYDRAGAHAQGHNKTTLGVCLIGGAGSLPTDKFADHFTPEQDKALRQWIDDMQADLPAITRISGHNEYAAKACPGFQVAEWLAEKPKPQPGPFAALVTILSRIFGGKS